MAVNVRKHTSMLHYTYIG